MPRTDRPYTTSRSGALARIRVRAKLNRTAAAARLGISPASLGNIERGGARASSKVLVLAAEVYGVSVYAVRRAYVADRNDFLVREKP